MNINYEKINYTYDKYIKLDTSKKNILILGKGFSKNERNNIINPVNIENAYNIYGDSELYSSYCDAYKITEMSNIYTVNCYTTDDFINIIDKVIQYDFNYIVPIGINFGDKIYNTKTQNLEYYSSYILNVLYQFSSLSTLIMTDKHAFAYEDIDHYLYNQEKITKSFINYLKTNNLGNIGSNLIFVLNMLKNIEYSNVILAAMLSKNDSSKYLDEINAIPVFDIDKNDISINCNYSFFKYNYLLNKTNIENLNNFRLKDDIYKKVLIDELIKKVLRIINLDEFKGKLYTSYTNLQIKSKIINYLKPYENKIFKSYSLKDIRFVKLNINTGYIYIKLSIVPYDTLESLNIVMEV